MDAQTILSALGDSGFADMLTTSKVREIQSAIDQIESAAPWPFLETSVDLDFDGSSAAPTNTPTNWRASLRLRDLTTNNRLQYIRLDDLEDRKVGFTAVGDPLYYYFEGTQLKVWPIPPASTGRLRWRYLKVSDRITDTATESQILIPKQHHDLIVVKTLGKLYRIDDDLDLAQYAEATAGQLLDAMKNDVMRQQYDLPDYVRVIDPDDWDYDL